MFIQTLCVIITIVFVSDRRNGNPDNNQTQGGAQIRITMRMIGKAGSTQLCYPAAEQQVERTSFD
ncbi:hypothetical protein Ciccas_010836 [Cichlidogyrus casuarinus]|uniref:Secreted protein n=1 Tax=Cichlidogyrus casuarinus TaxID=1844966 RepID=A0ABD2PXM6_9PLAT